MLQAALLLTALSKADVAFIVIGGMAAVAQGATYVTADLDLCYQRHPQNYQRLSHALHPFKPRLRGAPADLPFVLDAATLRAGLNFTLTTEVGDVDLLGEVMRLGSYEAVKAHAEEVELYDHRIWVLTLAGLIVSKQAAGRANAELDQKRLEFLREVSPRTLSQVGVVFNPTVEIEQESLSRLEGAARALGITLHPVAVRRPDDFEGAFARMASEGVDAVFVFSGPLTNTHAPQIVHLTARTQLPAIYGRRLFVDAGGLMSYAVDFREQYRRAATYVAKILKGAKPAALPVEQPLKFELVINLKTAQALDLTIPPTLLFQADEVIK
jgi:hypothetical protein